MLALTGCNTNTDTDKKPDDTTTDTDGDDTTTVNYGTVEAPLSVETFLTEVVKLNLENKQFSTEHFVVKGIVQSKPNYNSSYKSYSLRLADTKESETNISVAGAICDTDVTGPNQNDTIIVSGLAEAYNNSYSIYYKDTDSPSIKAVTLGTSTVTKVVEHATITGLNETYTNGATASFVAEPDDGYKIVSVTANSNEVNEVDGSYSFVVAGDTEVKVETEDASSTNVTKNIAINGTLFEISASNAKIASLTEDNITLTVDQNTSNTPISQSCGSKGYNDSLRLYANYKLTIKVDGGTLVKATFAFGKEKFVKDKLTCTNCTASDDNTLIANENVSDLSVVSSAKAFITNITIVYTPTAA